MVPPFILYLQTITEFMDPKDKSPSANISGWRAFVLLGLILFLAYSNSFDVPWHFDDYANIITNPKVHAQYPHLSTVAQPFISYLQDGHLNRPFALSSFALNWYLSKDHTFGYHAINLVIHMLSAFFLFMTLRALSSTPRLDGKYDRRQVFFISLLAAILWGVNPIQTQAVTYIVQRMASMCGMFYVLSIFFYVKARLSWNFRLKRALLFAACGLSFLAAFLTKENAAMLPFSLLLLEAVFFWDLDCRKVRLTFIGIALALGIAIIIGGAVLFYSGDPMALLNYEKRLFSPLERLLTQPRIILFYLTLIFYPAPHRLSLVHDIDISTSLFHPWTTLPSIIMVLAVIALAVFWIRKRPILSFAVLFFFLNHVIESSIIPLELIFEHRNYLPSLFLFWPVAVGLRRLIDLYHQKNVVIYYGLMAFIPLLIMGIGTGTYIRNIDWSSPKYLWEDAMSKAPNSSRPCHNLAWSHYQQVGDWNTALVLYQRALQREKTNKQQEPMIWNNIAAVYHFRGDFEKAAFFWQKSYESAPRGINPRHRLALALIKLDRLDEARSHLDSILSDYPQNIQALNLKGVILWRQNRPREALLLFRQCMQLAPGHGQFLINIGASYNSLGDYHKANLFFNEALRRTARSRIALLWQVKSKLDTGDTAACNTNLEELISTVPIDKLTVWLRKIFTQEIYKDEVVVPRKDTSLMDSIKAQYRRKSDRIGE